MSCKNNQFIDDIAFDCQSEPVEFDDLSQDLTKYQQQQPFQPHRQTPSQLIDNSQSELFGVFSPPLTTQIFRVPLKPKCRTQQIDCIFDLSFKYIYFANKLKSTLGIFSIFHLKGISGAIFIEAENINDVKLAIADNYQLSKQIEIVQDPSSLLHTTPIVNTLEPGQWVRIARHRIYQGDLARVLSTDEKTRKAVVKVIKRAPPQSQLSLLESKSETTHQISQVKLAKQKPQCIAPLPEMEKDVNKSISYFTYNNNISHESKMAIYDGFYCLTIGFEKLTIQNLRPKLEELQYFFPDIQNQLHLIAHFKEKKTDNYDQIQVGDTVRATEFSIYCTVTKVFNDGTYEVNIKRKIKGQVQEDFRVVEQNQIKKLFRKHQKVYITNGYYNGKVGTILQISDLRASVQLDQDNKILTFWLDDLANFQKIDYNPLEEEQIENSFKFRDFIKYGQFEDEIACVKSANAKFLIILNIKNVEMEVPICQAKKISTEKYFGICGNNQKVLKGDLIMIKVGLYRNQQCRVLHCYREFFYLLYQGSVILEKQQNCVFVCSRANPKRVKRDFENYNRQPQDQRNENGLTQRAIDSKRVVFCLEKENTNWSDQYITIPSGPWQGYQGLVVEEGDEYRLIQLANKNLQIRLTK